MIRFAAATLFGVLVAGQGTAFAQTPADIAHLVWPLGAPAISASAPAARDGFAGGFSALDVARLSGPLSTVSASAPHDVALMPTAGGPADLVRLSGGNAPALHGVFAAGRAVTVAGAAAN